MPKFHRELAEGDRIGPYVVDARLGEGGMAEVFSGHNATTGQRVALKRSLLDPETLHMRLPMFQREARIACKLLHANIVTTYELQVDAEGCPVLVMELLEGVSVKDVGPLLRKTSGGLRLAVELVHAAARALDYLHEQQDPDSPNKGALGLIHRDVAPDNLFVTFAGSVKLLDFGLAKEADDARLTRTGILKGKAAYMSPEQATGSALDQRTDQYALGITAYWLLTGVLPFERDNVPKTLTAVMKDPLTAASSINRQLNKKVDAVLARAVARDRTWRFPSCSAFALALDEALAKAERPVSDVTLATLAREAAEGQKPTIVLQPGRSARVGAQTSDPALELPTDPSGRVAAPVSDEDRTVIEPIPTHVTTSPEDKPPASSDERTRRDPAPIGKARRPPQQPTPIVRRPSGTELQSDSGGSSAAGEMQPVFTMPLSVPSGLHPAPAPSSMGAILGGAILAVVIAGLGVLWLLLPDVIGDRNEPGPPVVDASSVPAAIDAGAPGPTAGTSTPAMNPALTTAPDAPVPGSSLDAGDMSAPARPTDAEPVPRVLRIKAPPQIEWRAGDGAITRGTGSLVIGAGAQTVTAYDPELDVSATIPIAPDQTTVDYAGLPRTEVQILVRPWADVTIGNKKIGLTPLRPLKLVAGRYRLTLTHDSGEQVHEVDIGGGERVNLRYRF